MLEIKEFLEKLSFIDGIQMDNPTFEMEMTTTATTADLETPKSNKAAQSKARLKSTLAESSTNNSKDLLNNDKQLLGAKKLKRRNRMLLGALIMALILLGVAVGGIYLYINANSSRSTNEIELPQITISLQTSQSSSMSTMKIASSTSDTSRISILKHETFAGDSTTSTTSTLHTASNIVPESLTSTTSFSVRQRIETQDSSTSPTTITTLQSIADSPLFSSIVVATTSSLTLSAPTTTSFSITHSVEVQVYSPVTATTTTIQSSTDSPSPSLIEVATTSSSSAFASTTTTQSAVVQESSTLNTTIQALQSTTDSTSSSLIEVATTTSSSVFAHTTTSLSTEVQESSTPNTTIITLQFTTDSAPSSSIEVASTTSSTIVPYTITRTASPTATVTTLIKDNTKLKKVYGIVIDEMDVIYVILGQDPAAPKIYRVNQTSTVVTLSLIADLTNDNLSNSQDDQGMCYFNNSLYVPRMGQLTKIDLANNNQVSRFAGTGVVGPLNDGPNSTAVFCGATMCTADSLGNIYVGDTAFSHSIRIVNQTGYVTTLMGSLGDKAFGMVLNGTNNLLYSTWGPPLVYNIEISTKVRTVVYGNPTDPGPRDFLPGQGNSSQFANTGGLAFDELNNLYITSNNGRILAKANTTGYVSNFTGASTGNVAIDGIGNVARFNYMRLMAFDSKGRLFITDQYDNSIRMVTW